MWTDIIKYLSQILLYFIIFLICLGYMLLVENRQKIRDDWDHYRCNPLVMPFASYFGHNPAENFEGCLSVSFKMFFDVLMAPFNGMMSMISGLLGNLVTQLNFIRNLTAPIREFIKSAAQSVFKKTENLMNVVMFTFLKMNDILKRVFANFRLMVYTLEATQMTLTSTWNGPIGKMVRFWAPAADFFCFAGFTPIKMLSGHDKYISQLVIGDELYPSSRVYGILCSIAPEYMYNYKNVIVAGGHFVNDIDNIWRPVEQSPIAIKIKTPSSIQRIYSIWTTNHKICINDIEFADYDETVQTLAIQKQMICQQMDIEYTVKTPISELTGPEPEPNLLHADVEILMHDLTWKPISHLKLNDELFPKGNYIVAQIQKCIPTNMRNGYGLGNIVYDNNKWKLFSTIQIRQPLIINKETCYNIATKRGFFITRNYIVRDYLELSSAPEIFDIIEDMNILLLNMNHS